MELAEEDGLHEILRNDCIQNSVIVETAAEVLKGCNCIIFTIQQHHELWNQFGLGSILYCKIVAWRDAAD